MYRYMSLSLYIYIYIHTCVYIYIYIYTHTYIHAHITNSAEPRRATRSWSTASEFRNVVFEDVVFDDKICYHILYTYVSSYGVT